MVGLGVLPGGDSRAAADDVSADGSVIVGDSVSALGFEAFRWTSEGGMVGLGDLPGGMFESHAWDVSSDGSVIVGNGTTTLGPEAFVWTAAGGMQNLREKLIAGGATGLTGWTLIEPSGVSADGRTIVGFGRDALGRGEGWIATSRAVFAIAIGRRGCGRHRGIASPRHESRGGGAKRYYSITLQVRLLVCITSRLAPL